MVGRENGAGAGAIADTDVIAVFEAEFVDDAIVVENELVGAAPVEDAIAEAELVEVLVDVVAVDAVPVRITDAAAVEAELV